RTLPWGRSCSIHRTCERVARGIAVCPPERRGITAEAAIAATKEGETVSVEGPLRTSGGRTTLKGCSEIDPKTEKPLPVQACCNGVSRKIVVGDGKGILLSVVGCFGDESRLCCDLPVHDQTVVITGRL